MTVCSAENVPKEGCEGPCLICELREVKHKDLLSHAHKEKGPRLRTKMATIFMLFTHRSSP